MTLYGFCDASTRAYAAVVYLVLRTDAAKTVQFVVSKTRVAPLQAQSIPAFLLSKLIVAVSDSLQPTLPHLEISCYTDSQVALFWIRGISKEWKPFVQNRVNEIRKNVHPDHWRHCPGISNPADLPSRGLPPLELSVNQLWRRGPEWLDADNTPCGEARTHPMPEECSAELKTSALRSLNLVATDSEGSISELLDCESFGTLSRLLRVTAQVLRAVGVFKKSYIDISTNLTPEELAHAEGLWIMTAQRQLVQEKNFKAQEKQLNLFKDEKGIWRCGGRLSNAEIPYAPILLPRTHPLTKLIVRRAHERVCHNGVKETLTETRRSFWIPKGRSLTKCIIHRCVLCRRFEGAPFKTPPPPPLPTFRVKEDPAFSYTGVDFAGIRGSGAPEKVCCLRA